MPIASWVAQYVGIPHANLGRDRGGLDCWGLVRLVLAEQFGKELPPLLDSYESCLDERAVARTVLHQRFLLRAERVDAPDKVQPGDIVLASLRGHLCHVGVYVGDSCMLHVRSGTNAVVDRIDEARWAKRVEGFYRVP